MEPLWFCVAAQRLLLLNHAVIINRLQNETAANDEKEFLVPLFDIHAY